MWTWKPANHTDTLKEHIVFYDFGTHSGYLYKDSWICWKVIDRKILPDGSVVEIGEPTVEDWVPHTAFAVTKYPCKKEENVFTLPGWRLEKNK
jgi:hypothetical protein